MAVMVGDRLRTRLSEVGLSQSELARRANISQGTIGGLLSGKSRSSAHLHRIARELGTTPAYLTGEVDDPTLNAPEQPSLTPEETEFVRIHRGLDDRSRAALLHVARTMVSGTQQPVGAAANAIEPIDRIPDARSPSQAATTHEFTLPVLFPPEYALTRMFEALLAMLDPAAAREEQARLLAMNLPVALAQLRDLLPPVAPVPEAKPPASSKPLVGSR